MLDDEFGDGWRSAVAQDQRAAPVADKDERIMRHEGGIRHGVFLR
jgi:hypothetical protein